ncbi:MAG: hypothetical protein R3C60_06215 [Parvularculaceae bacterium]
MKRTFLVSTLVLAAAVAGGAAVAKSPKDGMRFDKDGDGKISVEELDARQKEFIAKADADGDGFITKDEMKTFREARRAEMQARRFPDGNGDGVVDASEWNAAMQERFTKLDKNGDGVISQDEMEKKGRHRHHRR